MKLIRKRKQLPETALHCRFRTDWRSQPVKASCVVSLMTTMMKPAVAVRGFERRIENGKLSQKTQKTKDLFVKYRKTKVSKMEKRIELEEWSKLVKIR